MASPSPLISVALCTWNGARWLRPQLDSILAQQDVALEVIALDDASSDDTLAILKEYAARDGRLRVHANADNMGHLRSFGKCMAMCSGDLIAPADQDDIWHSRKLRTLLDAMGGASLAYCDSRYVDADGRPMGRKVSDDLCMFEGHDALPLVLQNTVSGHAALLRRDVLTVALPLPGHGYHDWWLSLVAADHGGIVYVDAPLVDFRRHADACSAVGKASSSQPVLSRAQREAVWFQQRAQMANYFIQRFDGSDNRHVRDWVAMLTRLSQGDATGLMRLCFRDFRNPSKALRAWARFRRKASRIARGATTSD